MAIESLNQPPGILIRPLVFFESVAICEQVVESLDLAVMEPGDGVLVFDGEGVANVVREAAFSVPVVLLPLSG